MAATAARWFPVRTTPRRRPAAPGSMMISRTTHRTQTAPIPCLLESMTPSGRDSRLGSSESQSGGDRDGEKGRFGLREIRADRHTDPQQHVTVITRSGQSRRGTRRGCASRRAKWRGPHALASLQPCPGWSISFAAAMAPFIPASPTICHVASRRMTAAKRVPTRARGGRSRWPIGSS